MPGLLTLDDGHSETNLTLMGVSSGPVLQPVQPLEASEERMEQGGGEEGGPKSPQPILTQLSNSEYKFGGIDFRAEFISHPISEFNLMECADSSLPSFSDTYTKSVITTIEPRVFGAEAEYESRMRERRESSKSSSHHILQIKHEMFNSAETAAADNSLEPIRLNSVIIPTAVSATSSEVDSRGASPLQLPPLHNSIETFLQSHESETGSESSFNKDLSEPTSSGLYNPASTPSNLYNSTSTASSPYIPTSSSPTPSLYIPTSSTGSGSLYSIPTTSYSSPGGEYNGAAVLLTCNKLELEPDTLKLSASPM